MTLPAMVMYATSCIIFCVVVVILLTCKVMGLMDSDPGQRLTPARCDSIPNNSLLTFLQVLQKTACEGLRMFLHIARGHNFK